MKLVDIYWYSKLEELTEEQQREQIQQALTVQLEAARHYAAEARILRENAVKLKDIKTELYGSFITKVPVLRGERFVDVPLHSSTAKPYVAPKTLPPGIVHERVGKYLAVSCQVASESLLKPSLTYAVAVAGQHLVGTMIPRIAEDEDESPPPKDQDAKKKD